MKIYFKKVIPKNRLISNYPFGKRVPPWMSNQLLSSLHFTFMRIDCLSSMSIRIVFRLHISTNTTSYLKNIINFKCVNLISTLITNSFILKLISSRTAFSLSATIIVIIYEQSIMQTLKAGILRVLFQAINLHFSA